MQQNEIDFTPQITKQEFSPREFLLRYMHLIPWAIVTTAIALGIAYSKIRYTNPTYYASGKLIVKSEANASNSAKGKFSDLYMMQNAGNDFDDQVELVKSSSLASLVVQAKNLQMQYFYKGSIRTTSVHAPSSIVECKIVSLVDSGAGFSHQIEVVDNDNFKVQGISKPIRFGSIFETVQGRFIIEKKQVDIANNPNSTIIIRWFPLNETAKSLAGQMQVVAPATGSRVLTFGIVHEDPSTARDIVNGFLEIYQEYSLSEKRASARNAISFIDGQLELARDELSGVESNLQSFRERNKVVAPEEQATLYLDKVTKGETFIEEQSVQLKLIDYMWKYLSDSKNTYIGIPVVMGIDDVNFSGLVAEYNKLQIQREIALNTMPAGNPIIRDFETAMDKQRNEMVNALSNAKQNLQTRIQGYEGKNRIAGNELYGVPAKQRQVLDIMRKQKIAEALYTFLLERKLETSIGSASTTSNIEILEPAFSSGAPVSPNKRNIYMIALIIGLAIPAAMLFLTELFNDKIRARSDIDKFSTVPILGEIGHSDSKKTLIISARDRKYISEQFRVLRTSLQYVLTEKKNCHALLVTSSVSGEGKSFVSTNIAAVMAVSGKKTVILEFDLRKPKILSGLHMESQNTTGLTNYLVGNADLADIIYKVPDQENLYVIPCGTVPPNPAELLLNPRLKVLFEEVKNQFEMVVVDTAPAGLVSDCYLLGEHVDAAIYIVRHNYTFKKQLGMIQKIYNEKRLPNTSIVINDVHALVGYGQYYGYVNYGYQGYGYGYGNQLSNYFDVKEKKGVIGFIKNIFGI
jgi:capsular exopolysaccharide synthesis family protein